MKIGECGLGLSNAPSGNAQQFDFKNERGATGYAGLRKLAVAHLGGDVNLPFVSHTHRLHSDNPALDEVAQSDGQRRSAATAVELFAVDGAAGVVGRDNAARSRVLAV